MANESAVKFVKKLVAVFSKYPTAKETIQVYTEQLSKWHLTEAQWSDALSQIAEADRMDEKGNPDFSLPSLNEIYKYLRKQNKPKDNTDNLGWLHFELNNHKYAVRIMSVNGQWVNAPVSITDPFGNKISLQKYPGVAPIIPREATKVFYIPDKPKLDDNVIPIPPELSKQIQELANSDDIPF